MTEGLKTAAGELVFYMVEIQCLEDVPHHLFYLHEKGHIYLSPNTKLADERKAARLGTADLANAFVAAVTPTMQHRHGEQVLLIIERRSLSGWRSDSTKTRLLAQIEANTAIVRARIQQRNFAPNKAP